MGPLVARMRSACLLLTAAVSGMRASELAELLVGCRRTPQESYRGLRRFRIGGKLIKGQALGGTDDEWVVTEEVYEAIALGMCDSARCPQATHHPRHRPVREKTVEQNKVFIGMLGRGQKAERARPNLLQLLAERE